MLPDKNKLYIAIILIAAFIFYSGFLYSSLPVKNITSSKVSTEGKMLWQQNNCIACHQVYGLGGYLGPDLTNTYSLKGPAYISAFLKSGTVSMPNFQFSDHEVNALLSYLQNIDASGKADPRTFIINYDGTIKQ